ncbi:hypothetical protein FRB99_002150, partial [Tulasnella sp. 403]
MPSPTSPDNDDDPLRLESQPKMLAERQNVDLDEVVESSDADEREAEASKKPGYWQEVVAELHGRPRLRWKWEGTRLAYLAGTSVESPVDRVAGPSGASDRGDNFDRNKEDATNDTPRSFAGHNIISSQTSAIHIPSPTSHPQPPARLVSTPGPFSTFCSPKRGEDPTISNQSWGMDDTTFLWPSGNSPVSRERGPASGRHAGVGIETPASPNKSPSRSPRRARSDPPSSPPNVGHELLHIPPDPGVRRNLRQRTAMQLMPYTREALMYKATLLRAGAKEALVRNPKAVEPLKEPDAENVGMEETQDREWAESEQELDGNKPHERRPSEGPPVRHAQKKRRRRQSSANSSARVMETRPGPSSSENETAPPPPKKRSVDMIKKFIDDIGGSISDDEEMAPVPVLNLRRPKNYSTKFSNTRQQTAARSSSSQSLPALRSSPSSPTAIGIRSSEQPTTSTIRISSDSPGPSRRSTAFLIHELSPIPTDEEDIPKLVPHLRARSIAKARDGGSLSDHSVLHLSDEDSGREKTPEHIRRLDRQRKKALVKVFPAFMVKRMQAQAGVQERRIRSQRIESESDSSGESRPTSPSDHTSGRENGPPGRRRFVPNPGGRLDVQGDPESSDIEVLEHRRPAEVHREVSKDNPVNDDDRDNSGGKSTSSSGDEETDDEDVGHNDLNRWLERPTHVPTAARRSPPPRDGDLIDRMLSRHVNITSEPRRRRERPATGRRRRLKGQTTLLDYARDISSTRVSSDTPRHPSNTSGHRSKIYVNVDRQNKSSYISSRNTSHSTRRPRSSAVDVRWSRKSSGQSMQHAYSKSGRHTLLSDGDDYEQTEDLIAALQPVVGPSRPAPRPAITPTTVPQSGQQPIQHPYPVPQPRRRLPRNPTFNSSDLARKKRREELVDLGLPRVLTASRFAPTTYVGSGRLAQLVSLLTGQLQPVHPQPYRDFTHSIEVTDLEDRLPTLFDSLYEWAAQPPNNGKWSLDTDPKYHTMRFLCEYCSWIVHNTLTLPDTSRQDAGRILMLIREQVQHLFGRLKASLSTTSPGCFDRQAWLLWFAVEISLRIWYAENHLRHITVGMAVSPNLSEALGPTTPAAQYLHVLMGYLHDVYFTSFADDDSDRREDRETVEVRSDLRSISGELWVCCVHVVDALEGTRAEPPMRHPFWNRVYLSLETTPQGGVEDSERIWRSILTANLFSRFSVQGMVLTQQRLPTCWPMVLQAMSAVRLEADEKDRELPAAVLQHRDAYIRLILIRCLRLVKQWKWTLFDYDPLLARLLEIFHSRRTGNLRGEKADFPVFLRDLNEDAFLGDHDKKETSFGLLLKLVFLVAEDMRAWPTWAARGPKYLRRLASQILPLTNTNFTKDNPPIGEELSILFNRFAAAVVGMYLDPAQAAYRVEMARKYLDFKAAECNSRSVSIRGWMLIAIVHRRKQLDIQPVMGWYSSMVTVLLDELREAGKLGQAEATRFARLKTELSVDIMKLVGALRKVVESRPSDGVATYPDPIFLEQACLGQILQSSLSNDVRTNVEIRKLLQAFLHARTEVLGPRTSRGEAVAVQVESETQESDEFGDFSLDLNDPRVLAALGDGEKTPEMMKEDRVADVIKTTLSSAIFRFIHRFFTEVVERREQDPRCFSEEELDNVDRWVECWVGCSDVLVRNNVREWSQYERMGFESLDRIISSACRRMIELRFMLAVLRTDPTAYS